MLSNIVISKTAEYSLRGIVFFTKNPDAFFTIQEVAKATCAPKNYLAKILQTLSKTGFLHSQKGLGGGFKLACNSATTSVWDIVNAVDPIQAITSCPLQLSEHVRLCRLHALLNEAALGVEDTLKAVSLAEVVDGNLDGPQRKAGQPKQSTGICEFPSSKK
jgi:Rrf2 family protein